MRELLMVVLQTLALTLPKSVAAAERPGGPNSPANTAPRVAGRWSDETRPASSSWASAPGSSPSRRGSLTSRTSPAPRRLRQPAGVGQRRGDGSQYPEGPGQRQGYPPVPVLRPHVHDDLATALRVQAARLDRPTFTREALDREGPAGRSPRPIGSTVPTRELHGEIRRSGLRPGGPPRRTDIPLHAKTRAHGRRRPRLLDAIGAAGRAILCVAGPFDPEQHAQQIEAAFGSHPQGRRPGAGGSPPLKPGRIAATWDLRAPAPPHRLARAPGLRPRPPGPDRGISRPDAASLAPTPTSVR